MSLDEKLIDPLPSRERILDTSTSLVTDRGSDRTFRQVAIAHNVPTSAFEIVRIEFESGGDKVLRVTTQKLGYGICYTA